MNHGVDRNAAFPNDQGCLGYQFLFRKLLGLNWIDNYSQRWMPVVAFNLSAALEANDVPSRAALQYVGAYRILTFEQVPVENSY